MQPTQIQGLSMLPWLCSQDKVHIDWQLKSHTLESGDIVVLLPQDNTSLAAHRIICWQKNVIRTKGDRSPKWDLSHMQPVGLVVGRTRKGKKLIWGKQGHCGKKLSALLSQQNIKSDSFLRDPGLRMFFILTMKLLYPFQLFLTYLRGRK